MKSHQIDGLISKARVNVKLFEAQNGCPCKLLDSAVHVHCFKFFRAQKLYLIKRGKVLCLASNFFQGFVSFSELFQLLMQLNKIMIQTSQSKATGCTSSYKTEVCQLNHGLPAKL